MSEEQGLDESGFTYPNTRIRPQIGDRVAFCDDPDHLVVEDVIDTPERQANWGLDEFGIMLKGGAYGLIFERLPGTEVKFISRD